jgi:hypothetical protein
MPLYLSIAMPPLFQSMFSQAPILLSQARVIGEYLPSIPVTTDIFQVAFFVIAISLYLPLLRFSEVLFSMLHPFLDAVTQVTERKAEYYTMLLYFVLCIPVATTSVWLFTQKSFSESLFTVLVFLAFGFLLGQSQDRR